MDPGGSKGTKGRREKIMQHIKSGEGFDHVRVGRPHFSFGYAMMLEIGTNRNWIHHSPGHQNP